MKRVLTLFLMLTMLLGLSAGSAEAGALDAAFEAGSISGTLASASPLQGEADVDVLSVSPDGQTMLLQVDGFAQLYRDDGMLIPLWPDPDRGAGDAGGYLTDWLSTEDIWRVAMDTDGFIWSHDGSYAMIPYSKGMQNRYKTFNPVLVDARTGGVILLNAYENEGFSAIMHGACFSPDDHYLYYIMPASGPDDPMSIAGLDVVRFDLQAFEGETLLSLPYDGLLPGPQLACLDDGSLVYCTLPAKLSDPATVTRLYEDGGAWRSEILSEAPYLLQSERLLASELTGWIIAPSTMLNAMKPQSPAGTPLWIARISDGELLQEGWWGLDKATGALSPLDFDGCAEAQDYEPLLQTSYRIYGCAVSPDGRFALLCAMNSDRASEDARKIKFFLARFEDLACVPVAVSISEDDRFPLIVAAIQWREDGVLITSASKQRGSYRLILNP